MQLSLYLADAASLLRDWNYQFTTQARLTRWVNQGRRQVAKITGCIGIMVPGTAPYGAAANPGTALPGAAAPGMPPNNLFQTIINVERYPFAYANPFAQAQNAGVKQIVDVATVAVNQYGTRPVLQYLSFSDFQAYCRAYAYLAPSYPAVWTVYNQGTAGQVWLFPQPFAALEMEWETTCLPNDLNSNDDYDAVPDSFADAVKYYAAGMAFLGSYRYGNAEAMFETFANHIGIDRVAADRGKVPNYYWTSFVTAS